MDIRNWSLDRIMQLPDECFGRRYVISIEASLAGIDETLRISDSSFADRVVIYSIVIQATAGGIKPTRLRLALGFQLPANIAEMDGLEPILPGVGQKQNGPPLILQLNTNITRFDFLRMPILANGRKLVGDFRSVGTGAVTYIVWVVVASIPNEVPDCYGNRAAEQFDEMVRLMRIGVHLSCNAPVGSGRT